MHSCHPEHFSTLEDSGRHSSRCRTSLVSHHCHDYNFPRQSNQRITCIDLLFTRVFVSSHATSDMLQVYDEPTVLVAKRVTGEEEVPEGAVAVLTPDAPDVLSHVSVRARNMKVLFAICHEEGTLKEVEDKEGTTIALQVCCSQT